MENAISQIGNISEILLGNRFLNSVVLHLLKGIGILLMDAINQTDRLLYKKLSILRLLVV